MLKSRQSLRGLVVPAVVVVYIVLFWRDISHLQLTAAGFPRLLILLLGLLVVIQVVSEIRHRAPQPAATTEAVRDVVEVKSAQAQEVQAKGWLAAKPMLIVVVCLTAYIFVLPFAGAYPSTAGFVGLLMVTLGYRRPMVVGLSMALCVALVATFIETFNLPLAGFGS
jgi:hypothetical protein